MVPPPVMVEGATSPSMQEGAMSQQAAVYQWTTRIARQFPQLRASQAKV